MITFNQLRIDDDLKKGIEKCGFNELTEVQEKVIPLALDHLDIMAQAPTGTGKTCAFGLPILENICNSNSIRNATNTIYDGAVQSLILAPTRELAIQITEDLRDFCFFKEGIRILTVYGGEAIDRQIHALKKKPQIIVATPGRLMDHMERKTIRINQIHTLVLDEADEMLNMGFKEDIDFILSHIECKHQTMLFSATFSKEIEKIGQTYLHHPKIIKIESQGLTVDTIEQKYMIVEEENKLEVCARLIDTRNASLVMIFCNTKKGVDEVTSGLMQRNFVVEGLHGDMKQMQRDRVMSRFKGGSIQVLVASDVAARGLDIDDVDLVINYDIPQDDEYYVHRIGRTGRAKKEGFAVTFVSKNEKNRLRSIEIYLKTKIEPMKIPSLDEVMQVRMKRYIQSAILQYEEHKNKKITKTIQNILYQKLIEENILIENITVGFILSELSLEQNLEIEDSIFSFTENTQKKKITRLFISVGTKDHLNKKQFIDLITKRTTLKSNEITQIEIHESFSFFDVPTNHLEECLYAFSRKVDGKKIIIEEAKQKPMKESRKKRGGKNHKKVK